MQTFKTLFSFGSEPSAARSASAGLTPWLAKILVCCLACAHCVSALAIAAESKTRGKEDSGVGERDASSRNQSRIPSHYIDYQFKPQNSVAKNDELVESEGSGGYADSSTYLQKNKSVDEYLLSNLGLRKDLEILGRPFDINGDSSPEYKQYEDEFKNALNNSSDYWDQTSFYEQLLAHNLFKMRDDVFLYASPIFIVLGNLSNVLTLIVLRRKKLRHSSVCFYLRAYSVGNLCAINFVMAVAWVCFYFEKQYVTLLADWTCRLWTFMTNVMTFCSIWFVVIMNIDRLIYLTSRAKAKMYCTTFASKTIVIFVVIGLVVVSIHAMWTYALQPHGCFVPFQENDVHIMIWPWWSAAVYSYIPLSLLLGLNVAQGIALCARWGRCTPCNRCLPGPSCCATCCCSSTSSSENGSNKSCLKCITCERTPPSSPESAYTQDDFVVTVMVISITLFLLTVPATVINILDIHIPSSALNVDFVARMELTKKIVELLSGVNRSVSGFLLLACSRDIRSEFCCFMRSLLCCLPSNRMFKVFEMRNISNSEDSSPHIQVDYELCNNNEDMTVTDV